MPTLSEAGILMFNVEPEGFFARTAHAQPAQEKVRTLLSGSDPINSIKIQKPTLAGPAFVF